MAPPPWPPSEPSDRAPLGATLALGLVLAMAASLLLDGALVLLRHPTGIVVPGVGDQNQSAKTDAYLLTFAVILPAAALLTPRLADRLAAVAGRRAASGVAGGLGLALGAAIVLTRLAPQVGIHDGLRTLVALVALWWVAAGSLLALATRRRGAGLLGRLGARAPVCAAVGGLLLLAVALCLTNLGAVTVSGLVIGAVVAAGFALAVVRTPAATASTRALRRALGVLDGVLVIGLLLAVTNVIVFRTGGIPNAFFPPGIIQFHQDWLLGPANQLLGGGALLVGVPVSQYGVGFIYFLGAWFHIAPIGYGTYGLLDGIVTGLFYVCAYALLRIAGTRRALAIGVLALAVVAFVYHLYYEVGSLPQQGPLRFGLPMVIVLAEATALRFIRAARALRVLALIVLGVAAIWSLEMFIYTSITYVALVLFRVWLTPGDRRRRLVRELALAVGACVAAHLILVVWTVAATGQLPDWGQYLTYVDALVLGHVAAGQISYGFAAWSPGLALGAGSLGSALTVALLMRRAPGLVRAAPVRFLGLAGTSVYAVVLFSYTDNRSSTYLLPYVALPLLLAGALWLTVLLEAPAPRLLRAGTLGLAVIGAALMVGVAWPTVGTEFRDSALVRSYPGGGLRAALARLWHPPAIDPRAPAAVRLLERDVPGRRALVVLPDLPDLGTEILMRSHRSSPLFMGDPKADGFIDPSEWTGKLRTQLAALRPGALMLTDPAGLLIAAQLRGRSPELPLHHPIGSFNPQLEWILQRLAGRFTLRPVARTDGGLILVRLS